MDTFTRENALMHVANIPQFQPAPWQVAQSAAADARVAHVGTIDSLVALADAMPGQQLPPFGSVALPGDVLLAGRHAQEGRRELVAFGGGDAVILSVFDASTGKAALAHVDRNDQAAVDQALGAVLVYLGATNPTAELTATLFGGAWRTSPDDIGAKVRDTLVDQGITPTWHQWSFPMPGREDRHGVALDLSNGALTVFEHAVELAEDYFDSRPDDEVWSDFEASSSDMDAPSFESSEASGSRRASEGSETGILKTYGVLFRQDAASYQTVYGVSLESLND